MVGRKTGAKVQDLSGSRSLVLSTLNEAYNMTLSDNSRVLTQSRADFVYARMLSDLQRHLPPFYCMILFFSGMTMSASV